MEELKTRQGLPLSIKVKMTQTRIREWVNEFGEDGVYVSFSGGKDSTVLLHLVRELYPNVPAVFVDTGLEYPEIRDFVKTFENVEWLRPKMNFTKVIEKYGYPFISKEVAHKFHDLYLSHDNGRESYVDRQLQGNYISKNGKTNLVTIVQWKFLLNADFRISHKCCDVMKKEPVKRYRRETKREPMLATMAEESMLRTQNWMRHGCNMFDLKYPLSAPMAFWTEQDVLKYIKQHDLKIASVYGDIVMDYGAECAGQMDFADLGLADEVRPLKLTGCSRTGCMFCGFGCHLREEPGRFERMRETHPKQYEWIMKPKSEGGLGYKEIIDWLNENGNLNIRY
jgi:3'-phosphoadenosine 5'-phosphosulfate sulfotransferase (PAPS reductase)/FAD synthetase